MNQKQLLFGAALVATLAVAGANSETSLAQAPAAQAARPGRAPVTRPRPRANRVKAPVPSRRW